MPRRSSTSLSFPEASATRIRPPDDLTGDARKQFVDLVIACRADHFTDSEVPLLAAYSRVIVEEQRMSARLEAEGYVVDGKPSPVLPGLALARRTVSTFSRMLRLNPSARLLTPSPSSEPAPPISAFERMAMEAKRDGRN